LTASGVTDTQTVASGQNIENVTVSLEEDINIGEPIEIVVKSNKDGEYTFENVNANIDYNLDVAREANDDVSGINDGNYTSVVRGVDSLSDGETRTEEFNLDYRAQGSISGTVEASGQTTTQTVSSDTAIENRTVELYEPGVDPDNTSPTTTNETNSSGAYVFEDLDVNVSSGYTVKVVGGTNYTNASTDDIAVASGQDVTEDFSLNYSTSGEISGQVSNASGGQINEKVDVILYDAGSSTNEIANTTTDSDGNYTLDGVNVDVDNGYNVSFVAANYTNDFNDSVEVEVGEEVSVDIALSPS